MVIPLIFQATYSTVIREALESNDTSVFVLFMYLSIYKCKQLHSNYNDSSKTCILWELLRSYILFGSFHLQVSQTWIFIQDEDSKIVPSLFLIFFLTIFFYEESKITDLNFFFFFFGCQLTMPSPMPEYLNVHYICESASRLLFLSMHWARSIPSFQALG